MADSKALNITDIDVADKRVLIRCDFNVPLDKKTGEITNPARIVGALPTIKYAQEKGAKAVVLMSHMGRPDGQPNAKYSLKIVADELEKQLNQKIIFTNDCVGPEVENTVNSAPKGAIVLLENLRFHIEEEGSRKDEQGNKIKADQAAVDSFRQQLTKLGDVYVNDAFGTAHRAHSSVSGIKLDTRAAGFLVKKELEYFARVLEAPERPFLAILGGAKVSDKIQLIDNMLEKVNSLIICGGMAYTFKKAEGVSIGDSLFDKAGFEKVDEIKKKAEKHNVKLLIPTDFVISQEFSNDGANKVVTDKEGIPDKWEGLDIGPASREAFAEEIKKSKTILWNGPAGVFEFPTYAKGSNALLDAAVEAQKNGTNVIIGGGDTATVVAKAGKEDALAHVSTGGGSSLELLQGDVLPGVDYLSERK
ncbi:phosphoglycerate kinase [Wallemia mellicola CBS 633.66]|uniref:Phosphoglycerate kinase n=1 Tax=Wallemia mellicola (strain ATCC MYA-4683 / CBS 633.66) TaxID=671144 RepID=I4YIF4_WALMC|nr:phosphoglycerate kinase [Wallemia mellicola CBS 633.66]EIM23746.1 phosphoglycerate kinase [Wallemia mellicola CBS 633.66]|eukprot:XP_006956411.1 phosphoglycerate kinase [Wallemia mellicola CBS 633.66]